MVYLTTCDSPFSLDEVAGQIRKSSNFRFNWQFYQSSGIDPQSLSNLRQAMEAIIASPDLHGFLKESFEPMYEATFKVEPLHEHCRVDATDGEFESILARAVSDRLGAYSRHRGDVTAADKQRVKDVFRCMGEYCAYSLVPGNVPGCPVCAHHNNHLYSSWFFGVAWDWSLFVLWPQRHLLWVGCLTDTD